jgi:hypothetical protein
MSKVHIVPGVIVEGVNLEFYDQVLQFAYFLKEEVYITSGFRPQDKGSQHALGLAVDVVVPAYAGRLLDLYLAAERFAVFIGIGVYPYFQFNGKTVGGLHLDGRDIGDVGRAGARWLGIGRGNGNSYEALTAANLKKHGVI